MRIQKIKTLQGLAEREKHNTRNKTVLGADGSNNITIEGRTNLVRHVKALKEQLEKKNKKKFRKDAILCMEVLFTSNKSFFKRVDADQYFNECKAWLEDTFGSQNALQYSIHRDESVEHLHCILTTVKDDKFNYSSIIGGRKDLRALQDSFFKRVEYLGLQRGQKVEITKASYGHTRDWYKSVSKARTYAEALAPSEQLDYAIKGILSEEQINRLTSENMEFREELNIIKDKYKYLQEGIHQVIPNVSIKDLQTQGKMVIEINEIAEEMGL